MSQHARGAWFALGSATFLFPTYLACSETSDGTMGGGDRVNSTRVELAEMEGGGAGAGGEGGAAPAGRPSPVRVCTPDVVILDDLPECFVAEVSSTPLDCEAPGHEELRPAWEDAARERECLQRGLDATECADLFLCGIAKATGSAQSACETGDPDAPAGYCAVNQRSDGCSYAEVDTLFVYGTNPEAEALHVSCAIVDPE